jgi:hypothetical protein
MWEKDGTGDAGKIYENGCAIIPKPWNEDSSRQVLNGYMWRTRFLRNKVVSLLHSRS